MAVAILATVWQPGQANRISAVIVDLSVVGARIVASGSRSLPVGTAVEIELPDGAVGAAVVRRGAAWVYGVEFTDVSPQFRSYIFRAIADAPPEG